MLEPELYSGAGPEQIDVADRAAPPADVQLDDIRHAPAELDAAGPRGGLADHSGSPFES